ncbi:Nucleolar protein 14 [Trichostrongylus colubriformis]|uniref:Nucleolar protein 14 n=1 Tax=Trichostrongylus colubriformis TaxID=6319 RepID=A0AAN8IZX5_TRICO
MPKKFEALVELLNKYPAAKVDTVMQRLMKCYHPSLAQGNKKLLSKLFLYVLRYYDDLSNSSPNDDTLKVLGYLNKAMYSLMKFDVEFSVRCVRALIRQNWKKRMNKMKCPTQFSLITLLRLIVSLFPVSDRWHPVCSPAMALATVTLAKCQISNMTILTRQILLATVVSDFVEESKRYVPEAIAFCQGALLMAVENEEHERAPSSAFPISLPHRRMLYMNEKLPEDAEIKPLDLSMVFAEDETSMEDSDLMRCRVLRALVAVVQKYRILYAAHEHTFTATFSPFVELLKRLPTSRMPSVLAEEVEALTRSMEAECKLRARLTQMSREVTEKSMLKMLEPRFEENFDPERPRMSRDQKRQGARAEKEKLRHLVKKETRGAIKELRKDAVFLNRKQRKETAAKDRDRKEKTKRLMGGLQSQQGEWNKELFESGKKKKNIMANAEIECIVRDTRELMFQIGSGDRRVDEMIRRVNTVNEKMACMREYQNIMNAVNAFTINGSRRTILLSKQPSFKDVTSIFPDEGDDSTRDKERFRKLITETSGFMKACEDSTSNDLQKLSQLLQENQVLR